MLRIYEQSVTKSQLIYPHRCHPGMLCSTSRRYIAVHLILNSDMSHSQVNALTKYVAFLQIDRCQAKGIFDGVGDGKEITDLKPCIPQL